MGCIWPASSDSLAFTGSLVRTRTPDLTQMVRQPRLRHLCIRCDHHGHRDLCIDGPLHADFPPRIPDSLTCNRSWLLSLVWGVGFLCFVQSLRAVEGPPVTVVGAYSNIVITDVHSQGYSVELWKDDTHYFGFLLTAAGLAADTPTGILEDLRYDPSTHGLTFKAKLSTGRSSLDGARWMPSRDLYTFEGTLSPDQIAGTLIHVDALTPDRPGQPEDVKLYRTKDEEAAMMRPESYDQWTGMARQVLETRGPKW
jgi:hypothetical protein